MNLENGWQGKRVVLFRGCEAWDRGRGPALPGVEGYASLAG